MGIYIYRNNEKFGPYSLDQILTGRDQGAFLRTDLAWREGMADWQPLFELLLRDHGIPAGSYPSQNSAASVRPWPTSMDSASSQLAVASIIAGCVISGLCLPMLYLGFVLKEMVLLFFPLLGTAALILGHTANGEIQVSAGKLTGKRMAMIGTTLGYAGVFLAAVSIAVFLLVPGKMSRAGQKDAAAPTLSDLKALDNAIGAYALYSQKVAGDPVTADDLKGFLDPDSSLCKTFRDPLGHEYGPFSVGAPPKVPKQTYEVLSDVADSTFWSPYH
jgi:hypothetical protein